MDGHPVGVSQLPGGEGVCRKPLVNERDGALELGVVQVGIELAELVGQEHALVNDGAGRHRDDVKAVVVLNLGDFAIEGVGDHLAGDQELALEGVDIVEPFGAGDKHLLNDRLGGDNAFRQRGIIEGNHTLAEDFQTFGGNRLAHEFSATIAQGGIVGIKNHDRCVLPDIWQIEIGDLVEKGVRNLSENACAVTHERIGADRAAVF